jgi:hypothetical protein
MGIPTVRGLWSPATNVSAFAEMIRLRAALHMVRLQRRAAAERHLAYLKLMEGDLKTLRREVATLMPHLNLIQFVDAQRAPNLPGKK